MIVQKIKDKSFHGAGQGGGPHKEHKVRVEPTRRINQRLTGKCNIECSKNLDIFKEFQERKKKTFTCS